MRTERVDDDADLLAILHVARDTSLRGAGLSIKDALARTRYVADRTAFGPSDLISLLEKHPNLIAEWTTYSQDKRTWGGWFVTETGEVGRVGATQERLNFPSMAEAIADYVVRELDYWAGLTEEAEPGRRL